MSNTFKAGDRIARDCGCCPVRFGTVIRIDENAHWSLRVRVQFDGDDWVLGWPAIALRPAD